MDNAQAAHADRSLPPKLEAVMARLFELLGPEMGKTTAVKLPYLVDVVARHALGRSITEGSHQTWDFGVVTSEVFQFMTHGMGAGYKFNVEPDALSHQEKEVVDYVVDSYGGMTAGKLGALTKALNTDLDKSEWGTNRVAETGEDAYARLAPEWQAFYGKLQHMDFPDESTCLQIDDVDEYLWVMFG